MNRNFGNLHYAGNGQQGSVGEMSVLPCMDYNGADRRNVKVKGMKTL